MARAQNAKKVEPTMNAQELVLREPDRSQLDRLVQGLLEERLNAVVVADDEGLLDHYGRIFAARLRQQTSVKIEVYFPNSKEAVLARFNRILADLKVSEAISPTDSSAEHRVLVVYDGRATDLREAQLLGRLLRDFPGANTRVLMLLNRVGADTEPKVESMGKKALRWDLHRPTADEARALLDRARASGSISEAQALLDSIGVQGMEDAIAMKAGLSVLAKADAALGPLGTPQQAAASFAASLQRVAEKNQTVQPKRVAEQKQAANQDRPSVKEAPAPVAAASTRAGPEKEPAHGPTHEPAQKEGPAHEQEPAQEHDPGHQHDPALESAPKASPTPRRSQRSPLLLAGLVALSASAALTAWQHLGDQVLAELIPTEKLQAADPSSSPGPKNGGAKVAQEQSATAPRALGPLPEQVTNEELELQKRNAPLSIAAEPEPEKPAPPKPALVKPEAPKPALVKPEPPKPAARPGLVDLKPVAPGFYVQHASRETRAEVLDFWKTSPSLAKARLLKLKRIGAQGDNFVLLSGPFKTLDEARAFTQRSDLPKGSWIRQASELKKLLPEASP